MTTARSSDFDPRADNIGDCTALKLRRLTRKVSQIYDEALAPHGLTVGQLGILSALRRSRGIGIAALAERLSTEASTLSRLLKPLETVQLLAIEGDPDDRRAKLVFLTNAGRARVLAAGQDWHGAQQRVGELLGTSRLSALRFMLDDAFERL